MLNNFVDIINSQISGANAKVENREVGDSFIEVSGQKILEVCQLLKSHPQTGFNVLQVITGCDYPPETIEVSYILANYKQNYELILKVKLPRSKPEVESVAGVWKAANFQERECFDMLGVVFKNHPDHRRILCPDDWEGFPLRKDYVAAEKYKHMTVYPADKMNIPEREFAKKQKEAEDKAKAAAKAAGNPTTDN